MSMIVKSVTSSILDLLRIFAIWLDLVVFKLASWAYGIFYELSSSSLLSSLNLAAASQRLYTLLGIFMLFRLAFSFIKYIVNPDDMEKGTSKFITNLAVSLALIVSVPWIFNRAFKLQTYIMESNVIGNLILGMDEDRSDDDTFNASSYGRSIALMVFNAFFRPDSTAIEGLDSCNNLLVYYNDYVVPDGESKVTYVGGADATLEKESRNIAACVNKLNELNVDNNNVEIGTRFYISSKNADMSLLTDEDVLNAKIGEHYIINYTSIVSFITLGFLALLFISFSFDVAIRNVKLCFLQIIAPIPIILNIEPGDTKGDKRSLNWWVKECLRTYVDLFIRVATVYFGVFLINILFTGNSILGSNNVSPWFQIFMILGILLFVKQVPEMIGKAFGIDVKGQFSLNPLRRLRENKLTGTLIGAGAGLIAGHSLGSMIRGGQAGYNGRRILENMHEQAGRSRQMRDARAAGSTFAGRTFERINRTFGTNLGTRRHATTASVARSNAAIEQRIKRYEAEEKRQSALASSISAVEERMRTNVREHPNRTGAAGDRYTELNTAIEQANAMPVTANAQLSARIDSARARLNGLTVSQDLLDQQSNLEKQHKALAGSDFQKSADLKNQLDAVTNQIQRIQDERANAEEELNRLNDEYIGDLRQQEQNKANAIVAARRALDDFVNGTGDDSLLGMYEHAMNTDPNFERDNTLENLLAEAREQAHANGLELGDTVADRHTQMGAAKGQASQLRTRIIQDNATIRESGEVEFGRGDNRTNTTSRDIADANARAIGGPGGRH